MNDPDWMLNEIPDRIDPPRGPHSSKTCRVCAHLDLFADTCKAFPQGIPEEIWRTRGGHRESYPGDNGILFELRISPNLPASAYEIPDFLKRRE